MPKRNHVSDDDAEFIERFCKFRRLKPNWPQAEIISSPISEHECLVIPFSKGGHEIRGCVYFFISGKNKREICFLKKGLNDYYRDEHSLRELIGLPLTNELYVEPRKIISFFENGCIEWSWGKGENKDDGRARAALSQLSS